MRWEKENEYLQAEVLWKSRQGAVLSMEQGIQGPSLVGIVKEKLGLRELFLENSGHVLPTHRLSADKHMLPL